MIWREGERVLASIMKINLFLPTRQERVFLMNREEGEWETVFLPTRQERGFSDE